MSVSAQAPTTPEPGKPESGAQEPLVSGPEESKAKPARPLVVTGAIAACAAAASGLAVLTTLTAIGWITAPHVGIGTGLGGVLRTAALLWLVAHHVGFTVRGAGRIGMLPLGLVLLPGALLALAGRWVVHAGRVTRLRHVGYAAVALALPYTLLAGALAVASRTSAASPSLWQAIVTSFLLALVAGGLGAARGLAPWSRLAGLMAVRPRSIVLGMLGSGAVLVAAGAALAGGSLAAHAHEFRAATDVLNPGPAGAALLLLAQLAYAPNAIIWAIAYALGPGFAFGAGTVVAPTGSALGAVPVFPMLAALPSGSRSAGPALVPVLILAVPYLAGMFGGFVTVRIAPTPTIEAAPLWGFMAGAATGALAGLAAAFSGGPLGDGRLAAVGPSGWQVGLVGVLQIGVTAALTAAAANWLILRRAARRRGAARLAARDKAAACAAAADPAAEVGEAWTGEGWAGEEWVSTEWASPEAPAAVVPAEDEAEPEADDPIRFEDPGLAVPRITPGVVDENDDAGGHRIYFNPWAAYDHDDHDPADP